jgi:hypothetical protein
MDKHFVYASTAELLESNKRPEQQNGDPWRLSDELPEATGKGYSTPPMDEHSS